MVIVILHDSIWTEPLRWYTLHPYPAGEAEGRFLHGTRYGGLGQCCLLLCTVVRDMSHILMAIMERAGFNQSMVLKFTIEMGSVGRDTGKSHNLKAGRVVSSLSIIAWMIGSYN